jgi:hypothetical protein
LLCEDIIQQRTFIERILFGTIKYKILILSLTALTRPEIAYNRELIDFCFKCVCMEWRMNGKKVRSLELGIHNNVITKSQSVRIFYFGEK